MLSEFDQDGNLPEGIYLATEDEVFERFAIPSARRQWLGERLRSILAPAKSTGQLARVFLWRSFSQAKRYQTISMCCSWGRISPGEGL
jgi:hypothetical protein